MKLATCLLFCSASWTQSSAQTEQARSAFRVAATAGFVFYSDPLINVHDFLYAHAVATKEMDPPHDCLGTLPAIDREAFEKAGRRYQDTWRERSETFNTLLIGLRYELAGFAAVNVAPDSMTGPLMALLHDALPAYRACWWSDHDRRNRQWIAELLPRLQQHGDTLRTRLARAFQADWTGGPIPVDVVGFATQTGANSVVDPHHIMISSTDSSYRGDSALEMVFHEAAHTIVGMGPDGIARALRDTTVVQTRTPPRDLSHVVLFYTVGRLTQQRLAQTGTTVYQPYIYRERLFERVWTRYQQPLEAHWQPYLDGTADLNTAIRNLVRALPSREE